MRRKSRCRSRSRFRWPWLWIIAAPLAALFVAILLLAVQQGRWDLIGQLAVSGLSPPVVGMWLGCCCANPSCGPCCRDRGCQSESVEARITGVAGSGGPFNCSGDCNDTFSDWTGLTGTTSEYFDGECVWDNGVSSTPPVPCGTPGDDATPGFEFNTEAGFTLGFAQRRFNCDGTIDETPGECWLTAILTGNSTTSGVGSSGPFTVIFEKQLTGPFPIDCEGLHTLTYKCGTGFVACDWTAAEVEVNFVFDGQCDPTATFDPWADDVDFAIEALCPEVDGTLANLTNDAQLTPPPATQRWENVAGIGTAGVFMFTAVLQWDHQQCDYALTLTQVGTETSCRLVGLTQTKHATAACEPFELLFEDFELEGDPEQGPCECEPDLFFDVRITEP